MKKINTATLAWLTIFALLSCLVCKAETKVPCFIFSGDADNEQRIDLVKLNRITFGDNSMVISSSKDESMETVELLYSLYHHLEIGDATPNVIITGIEPVDTDLDIDSRLFVDTQAGLLHLETSIDSSFSVGVFSISGQLLLASDLRSGDAVSLTTLSPGVYIAVATDGQSKLTLKFTLD